MYGKKLLSYMSVKTLCPPLLHVLRVWLDHSATMPAFLHQGYASLFPRMGDTVLEKAMALAWMCQTASKNSVPLSFEKTGSLESVVVVLCLLHRVYTCYCLTKWLPLLLSRRSSFL